LPSGVTTFSYRYYGEGGKQREIPLGLYRSVTVEQARKSAQEHAGDVAKERDPAADKKVAIARSENTVNHILDRWLDHARRSKQRSSDRVARLFDQHVRPAIGDHVIYDLGRADVANMLNRIAEGKSANQTKAAPTMAKRVRAHLNA